MSQRRERICYICVGAGADSADHIIPRGFFPPRRPSDLITLPAHLSCHNRLSEDYARAILAGMSERNPTAQRLFDLVVRPSLRRSDLGGMKLRRDLIHTLVPRIEIRSPSGVIIGKSPGVRFDRSRVYPLLTKIVRGLYLHHAGAFLPVNAEFISWGLNERPVGALETAFSQSVPGLSYVGVFECRYCLLKDGSVWWLRFYEGVIFRCIIQTEQQLQN